MILPIVAYGSDVLRKPCIDITKSHTDLDVLISNMFETMYAASGVGLAAPQINKSLRLFTMIAPPSILVIVLIGSKLNIVISENVPTFFLL